MSRKLTMTLGSILVLLNQPVAAIDISTEYIWPAGIAPPGASANNDSAIAPFDPTIPFAAPPVGLSLLMNYAAAYYEDILHDFHQLHINYWYEDIDGDFLGINFPVNSDIPGDPAQRIIEANIQIDTHWPNGTLRNWFIDFSPADDSEFMMHQTLWRDISSTQRNNWYNDFGNDIPDTFEVGYHGDAVDDGPGDGAIDMLTVVLHEFGHSLGVPDYNALALADLDYDFNSDFVFGESLAAVVETNQNDHLINPEAMMKPGIGASQRERPSHTDLFAMASGNDYFVLDVPRREFYGGTSWHHAGNWSGNRVPEADDEVFVRDGNLAQLSTGNGLAASLYVAEGAVVNTNSHTLDVAGTIVVEGAMPGAQANVVVNAGGRLFADTVELNEGGLLTVTASAASPEVDAQTIDINDGGVLLGNGDVRFSFLSNSGAINAIAGPSDTLALLTGNLDLDGDGTGQVNAVLGDLRISAVITDDFDGQFNVGAGREATIFGSTFTVGASAASDAEVNLQGGAAGPARLVKPIGPGFAFEFGSLNVSGEAEIEGSTTFEAGFSTNIAAGANLTLLQYASLRGAAFYGAGTLTLHGATVEEDTVMNLGDVDLDGDLGTAITTVDSASLTLHVDAFDTLNRFDGELNLDGSSALLAVHLNDLGDDWQMDGTLNANGGLGAAQDKLTGSPVRVTGTINADNNVQFSAPLDISGTVMLADSSTEFWLANGTHVIRNTALVSGAGQVVVEQTGTLQLEDGAMLAADVFSLGRVEPGASLGTATIDADYFQQAAATLGIELAGAPFTNQDLLQVSGDAHLAGELEVTVIEGAMPSIGPVYTLLTADNVNGQFDTLTLLSETIFSYQATVGYTGVRVTLRFTDVTMFGDFDDDLSLGCADVDALIAAIAGGTMDLTFDLNGDGNVNYADLEEWLSVAGTHNVDGPYLVGDANLDGNVNGQDFLIWNTNKFTTNPSWCSGDFTADGFINGADFLEWNANKFMMSDDRMPTVPEPQSLMAVAILAFGSIASVRRRIV